ncbi:hypothetical protein BP6252_08768 [Coleophoma cylindrospora]|uniref:HORMA domain-containing protein n=1 Tax=Coleophoma cylindrospora TaxID=1849047 RepID=A0A3D8R741_9HELO|nr:hypothetical protein BP6252_08768 [Coleophoma cylindrospora]
MPPTRPPPKPVQLTTQIALLQTLSSFLTVAIHTILYARSIYPAEYSSPSLSSPPVPLPPHLQARTHDESANRTFLLTRAYNFPVRQNRHPDVCKWILATISHIEALMKKGTVARIVVPIHHISTGEVMERYIFDVSTFPSIPANSLYVPFEDTSLAAGPSATEREHENEDGKLAQPQSLVDIEEQLRATIRKLAYAAEKLDPLPEEECTFTVAVELKDSETAEPPIDHLGIWEASEPSLQPREKASATDNLDEGEHSKRKERGRDIGGVKSVAVRNVEAGEFRIESWIEEGRRSGWRNIGMMGGDGMTEQEGRLGLNKRI